VKGGALKSAQRLRLRVADFTASRAASTEARSGRAVGAASTTAAGSGRTLVGSHGKAKKGGGPHEQHMPQFQDRLPKPKQARLAPDVAAALARKLAHDGGALRGGRREGEAHRQRENGQTYPGLGASHDASGSFLDVW